MIPGNSGFHLRVNVGTGFGFEMRYLKEK